METPERDPSIRALRGLTIAVCALTAVMAVFVTLYVVAYIPSFTLSSARPADSTVAESAPLIESFARYPDTVQSRREAERDRGDGQLMFFVGSPASFRFSTSFYGERLAGLGAMPIDLRRRQIGEQRLQSDVT